MRADCRLVGHDNFVGETNKRTFARRDLMSITPLLLVSVFAGLSQLSCCPVSVALRCPLGDIVVFGFLGKNNYQEMSADAPLHALSSSGIDWGHSG